jgi:pyruvate dehydrogenase E2 component (dihydrolipoamide acetyltransferase)
MIEFRMPSLGADMEAGTLVEWLKRPGDAVRRGDIVAVVETQKGAIEIEIFDDGMIDSVIVEPGRKVPVGTVLALVRAPGEAPGAVGPTPVAVAATPSMPAAPSVARPVPLQPLVPAEIATRIRISPFAARRAAELKVDVTKLAGTGPGGAITVSDVEHAAAPCGAVAAVVTAPSARPSVRAGGFDARQMRAAIAAAMSRSKREIPHYYLATTIDFERASVWLEAENARRPVTKRMLPAVLLVKAVALGLRAAPELNGVWDSGEARQMAEIHIGWAIALRGGGLIAPALRDADKRSLPELMAAMRDLVSRARSGGLRASELSDPSITITSLGESGVEQVFGIIIPPQLAMVGFGRIVPRPTSVEGQIVTRRVIEASLSGDHRASDGHRGALFLAAVSRLLQEPERL